MLILWRTLYILGSISAALLVIQHSEPITNLLLTWSLALTLATFVLVFGKAWEGPIKCIVP